MRWRRRWEEDWFDWEEDGPKLIKRIVLGVISAALAVAGCFVFVSSNVGMFGGGIHEGFASDSFEESLEDSLEDSSEEIVEEDSDIVYARDFTFERIEGREAYRVTGLSAEGMRKTDVVIPNVYEGLPVVEIKGSDISGGAFSNCSSLTSVVIGDSVTTIGEYAFSNCSSLTSVEIGDRVTTIGSYAFYDCNSLPYNEYVNCKYLGNENNPYHALIEVTSNNYSTYTIHEDTKMIADRAFFGCERMTNIVIPDSVTTIGSFAFDDCDSLTSVVIPDSVTSIGSQAFSYCSNLTSVVIGDSVTSIGEYAFYNCSSLKTVYYKGTASDWDNMSISSSGNASLTDAARYYYSETAPTEEGNWWHYNAQGNVKVWDEEEIDLIHARDFTFERISGREAYRVTGLSEEGMRKTDVIIPNVYEGLPVTSIGERAFYGCHSLTSVVIPDSVTSIGGDAFYGCSCLTSVTCPAFAISYIPKTNLQTVVITSGDSIGFSAFYDCDGLTSVVIGDSVTTIGQYAFYDCGHLTNVAIGNGVTTIGNSAFYFCSSLTNVVMGDSVTTIGERAFQHCGDLTSIVIPDRVTTIGQYAFYDCYRLTSVVMGANVVKVEERAFYYCKSLTTVYYKGKASAWYMISTGRDNDSLTSATRYYYSQMEPINSGKYWGYDENSEIEIWEIQAPTYSQGLVYTLNADNASYSVTGIGTCADMDMVIPGLYEGLPVTTIAAFAFRNCDNLTSVVIGDSVTTIANYAFAYCNSLTSVVVSDSVTTIDYNAFYDCSLTTVYYKGSESEWSNILIYVSMDAWGNSYLTDATKYYYDESESVAMWWHYDENGNIVHA